MRYSTAKIDFCGGKLLPCSFSVYSVNMQHIYDNIQRIYLDVNMIYHYINMRVNFVYMQFHCITCPHKYVI